MKKFLAIGLVSLMFCLPVGAIEASQQPSLISVKGTASVDVKPDTANITIAVETESKKINDAINENNLKSEKVYNSLKKLLGKKGKLKTTSFQTRPIYRYDKVSRKQKLEGYRVKNQIIAKTTDIARVGSVIETALNAGANRVDGLSYEVSNKKEICQELLAEAAQNAKKEAEILAKALGVEIKGVKRISSSYNGISPRPYMRKSYGGMMAEAADSMAAPPIEAGENTITVQVFVDFSI